MNGITYTPEEIAALRYIDRGLAQLELWANVGGGDAYQ